MRWTLGATEEKGLQGKGEGAAEMARKGGRRICSKEARRGMQEFIHSAIKPDLISIP